MRNPDGKLMTGREYSRMYSEWMHDQDNDPSFRPSQAAQGAGHGQRLLEHRKARVEEAAHVGVGSREERPSLGAGLVSPVERGLVPSKMHGDGVFAQFYNRQVEIQLRNESRLKQEKLSALTQEVAEMSPRPQISARSTRMAANQQELARVYDEVRLEREAQRELLVLLHTPRAASRAISGDNDKLYYEQKAWEEQRQQRLEQRRALKKQEADAQEDCCFTPRILHPGGSPKVPFPERLYTARSAANRCLGWLRAQLKQGQLSKPQGQRLRAAIAKLTEEQATEFAGTAERLSEPAAIQEFVDKQLRGRAEEPRVVEQSAVQQITARIEGIMQRRKDPLYRNNQVQRKMAKEVEGLQKELQRAKQEEARKSGCAEPSRAVRALSTNERAYMSRQAIAAYERRKRGTERCA